MALVKKTAEFKISKRKDNRYSVVDAKGQPINGEEKVKILLAEGLIKLSEPQQAPAEEPAEEVAEDAGEEASEEAAEEDKAAE